MKKYNLSNIMKRAWELVKKEGTGISEALRRAWKEAKSLKEQIIKMLDRLVDIAKCEGWNYDVVAKDWNNYGKSRTYFSIVETRRHSTHYVKYDFGYIDNITEKYVAGKKDIFSGYDLSGSKIR